MQGRSKLFLVLFISIWNKRHRQEAFVTLHAWSKLWIIFLSLCHNFFLAEQIISSDKLETVYYVYDSFKSSLQSIPAEDLVPVHICHWSCSYIFSCHGYGVKDVIFQSVYWAIWSLSYALCQMLNTCLGPF